ncbi:MAG: hypothetical protein ACLFSZ_07450 [Puniceicoccaceae bacterium]
MKDAPSGGFSGRKVASEGGSIPEQCITCDSIAVLLGGNSRLGRVPELKSCWNTIDPRPSGAHIEKLETISVAAKIVAVKKS